MFSISAAIIPVIRCKWEQSMYVVISEQYKHLQITKGASHSLLRDYRQLESGGGLRFTPNPTHLPQYDAFEPDNAKGFRNFTTMRWMKQDLK